MTIINHTNTTLQRMIYSRFRRQVLLALCIIIFLPLHSAEVSAQSDSYYNERTARIDRHALDTPSSAEVSIEKLASYLISPAQNDTEKIRAIFRWITSNIYYDIDSYKTLEFKNKNANAVLKERLAVCSGYSQLLNELAKAAGLETEIILGYSKGYGYVTDLDDPRAKHSWNAVKLGDKWYLLDCTWGAGYIDDDMTYKQHFQEHYFLTPSDKFIYTHFPNEEKWQLLQNPISKEAFIELPILKPAFFTHGLQIASHKKGLIRTSSFLTVKLKAPEHVSIIAQLIQDDNNLDKSYTFSQIEDDFYYIRSVFPKSGDYILRIFVAPIGEERHEWACDYSIKATESADPTTCFPYTYIAYQANRAYLHSPLYGKLRANREHTFKIDVPGALDVAAFQGDNSVRFEKVSHRGSTFSVTAEFGYGDIEIGAKFTHGNRYSILLKYQTY